jgi:hypothetical protein
MSHYLFTKKHQSLFPSLSRYFRFIFGITLFSACIEKDDIQPVVILFEDEKEDLCVMKTIADNEDVRIIILGLSTKSPISLIKLSEFNMRLKIAINNPAIAKSMLYKPEELIPMVSSFFRTHGKSSILQDLTNTIYYLKNGILMFQSKDLDWDDAETKFLRPAAHWWNVFVERIDRYQSCFILLGMGADIQEINDNVALLSEFISTIKKFDRQIIQGLRIETIEQIIGCLGKIFDVLSNMGQRLGIEIK